MALVKCPQCEHEISDKAYNCPHCGYKTNQKSMWQNQKNELREHKKIVIGIIIFIVMIFVIILYKTNQSNVSPFKSISNLEQREEVHKKLGEPNRVSDSYEIDEYYNSKFVGLRGSLNIWYVGKDEISHAIWHKEIPTSKSLNDYRKSIKKIIKYYTKLYGNPSKQDDDYEWTDFNGDSIELRLVNRDNDELLPDEIQLWYHR